MKQLESKIQRKTTESPNSNIGKNRLYIEGQRREIANLRNETRILRTILDLQTGTVDGNKQKIVSLIERFNTTEEKNDIKEPIEHLIQLSKMNLARTCLHLAMYGISKS